MGSFITHQVVAELTPNMGPILQASTISIVLGHGHLQDTGCGGQAFPPWFVPIEVLVSFVGCFLGKAQRFHSMSAVILCHE